MHAWKHILWTVGNCGFGMLLQTKVLTAVFSLSHGDFLSSWCSSDLPVKEEDATLEYDSFAAAGWVLDNFFSVGILHSKNLDFTLIPSIMAPASYAHQRTSLFVKVIANLHCFVPTICEGQSTLYHFFILDDIFFGMTSIFNYNPYLVHRTGKKSIPSWICRLFKNGYCQNITWIFRYFWWFKSCRQCLQESAYVLLLWFLFYLHIYSATQSATVFSCLWVLYMCLGSLLSQAESLIPNFLNEEDVQLLRWFNLRPHSSCT